MGNEVRIIGADALQKIRALYARWEVVRRAPGVVFAAKLPDVAITCYASGKALFQGAGAAREAAQFSATSSAAASKRTSSKGDELPADLAQLSAIGSDETGTGDYFGPLAVAACYVSRDAIPLLREIGVRDSKQLQDAAMLRMRKDIEACTVSSVHVLPMEKYNEKTAAGWSQGKIKAILHNYAIGRVLDALGGERPEAILIDQFAERSTYYAHLRGEARTVQEGVLFATKAEQLHIAVAAASILARAAFVEQMDALSSAAGMRIPKGAGQPVDEAAAQLLLKKGEPFLRSISKWHFANTQKAQKLAQRMRRPF